VFSTDDQKIYDREVLRLGLSLSALPSGGRRIAMLHYPPFNENRAPSGFTEQLERAGVELVVYGHLHGRSCRGGFEGVRNGVEYRLVSADHIEFKPKLILEL
jgi:predicted phosphohydrolase